MTVPLASIPLDDSLADACSEIARLSSPVSAENAWPAEQLRTLTRTNTLRLGIPPEFGGAACTDRDQAVHYLALSQACLQTCFILTQRNAAVQRLVASSNEELKQSLLPCLATGELFGTVGISHLTTSRQHLRQPVVTATPLANDHYRLQGEVPWVTGASQAAIIVTGGVLADGNQLLVALPTDHPDVRIHPDAQLLALTGSATTSVQLDNVELSPEQFLFPPTQQVLKKTGGGAGGLSTTTLALGLSRAALDFLWRESQLRPDLETVTTPLIQEANSLLTDLLEATDSTLFPAEKTDLLRSQANSLVLRSTQAALIASKGAGFVRGHPAERWVRQAHFFLVWSCPASVANAALRELSRPFDCPLS